MKDLCLGQAPLRLDDVISVALGRQAVRIDPDAGKRISSIRSAVEGLIETSAEPIYGLNTGFGALAEQSIPSDQLTRLQTNLVRSHATGVGTSFDIPTTRAMMLLRANVLLVGTSGVRLEVPQLLLDMLAKKIIPIIPEKGSVGASGDLAPLAHLALVLMGEGEARVDGKILPGARALELKGLQPLELQPKEGLALINGTQAMTADGALVIQRAINLAKVADIAGACSVQSLLGSAHPFDERIHAVRPHRGQIKSARNMRRLTASSAIISSHSDCDKVQDPYSLRCIPQVHGASRDALVHVRSVIDVECGAATDNPLVFEETDGSLTFLSGGNFHGQPIALACDYLGIAVSELANISERRIEQLVNPNLSSGLPPFLAAESGLNSGFMIAQVTAAALVSENKVLAHPASVDSIPSSANREDHVSMGTISARKARNIVEHAETVLGIELLCALQGMYLRRPLKASPPMEALIERVRQTIAPLDEDRFLGGDINEISNLVRSGELIAVVEREVGELE